MFDELISKGFELEKLEESDLALLLPLFTPDHAYLHFLRRYGRPTKPNWTFFSPKRVLVEIEKQRSFYEDASFGDSEEDLEILKNEQLFRDRLIPFQERNGELFCFLNIKNNPPLIIDIYHDDFELSGIGLEHSVYTTDFNTHLKWMLSTLSGDSYPPTTHSENSIL